MTDARSETGSIIRPVGKEPWRPQNVTSKSQLIEWVNNLLDLGLTRLEEFSSGAIYCQILDAYFENVISLNKINFVAREEYEFITNYKYLQSAFDLLGISREINVEKLMKGSPSDGLEFLQWLHKILKKRKPLPMYNPRERRHNSLKGGTDSIPLPSWMSGSFNVYGKVENKGEYSNLYLSEPSGPPSLDGRSSRTPPPMKGSFAARKQHNSIGKGQNSRSFAVDDRPSPCPVHLADIKDPKKQRSKTRVSGEFEDLQNATYRNNHVVPTTPTRTPRVHLETGGNSSNGGAGNADSGTPVSYSVDIRAVRSDGGKSSASDIPKIHFFTEKALAEMGENSYEAIEQAMATIKVAIPSFERLLQDFGKENDSYPYRGKVRSMRDVINTLFRHCNLLLQDLKELRFQTKEEGNANTRKFKKTTKELEKLKGVFGKLSMKLSGSENANLVPKSVKFCITDQQKALSNTKGLDSCLRQIGAAQAALAQALLQNTVEGSRAILNSIDAPSSSQSGIAEVSKALAASSVQDNEAQKRTQNTSRTIRIGDFQIRRLKNGDIYKGRYERSKKNGEGVYHFMNGDVYEGDFRDDRMGGYGLYTFSHEGRYEGSWENAIYEGAGTETFARGSTYHGEYSRGVRNGWGVCRYYNGDYYEGQWKGGLREGRGMQQCTDDSNYVGDYVEGKRHGFGIYSFPNGDRYLGEYMYDIPHGWGVYLFSTGQYYEGQWQSGKKHGWCIYTIDTGEKWAGEWVDGRPKWVQGLSEGENMEKWPHEIYEKVELAWAACKKAKEAAKEGSNRADEHWCNDGNIQKSIREAVAKADLAATKAQAARKKAIEVACKLDDLAGGKESSFKC